MQKRFPRIHTVFKGLEKKLRGKKVKKMKTKQKKNIRVSRMSGGNFYSFSGVRKVSIILPNQIGRLEIYLKYAPIMRTGLSDSR